MKSAIVAVLCVAFLLQTSQTQVQNLPVAVTWNYYPQPKTLVLHVLNNSGKDIIGYNVTVGWKNPDGTWNDRVGRLPYRRDSLVPLVMIQMAKDPIAEERTQREFGNGPYVTGTTQDVTLRWGINTDFGLDAVADVVFYADGTFYEQNEDAFKRMLADRQRQLLAIKKSNEIIQNALADSTNEHPITTAITGLARAATESMSRKQDNFDPEQGLERFLEPVIRTMQMMQERRIGGYPGNTERERLRQYLDEHEKKVELMTPHCHLEIALKAVAPDSAK
jgi:hypothetical protein